jgi:hypothetical protein
MLQEFDSERKWKFSMAKKIAQRANKSIVDQATKGERKQKEEEHRMRKVAVNISKDVKKFWIKIEKLASSFILFNVIYYCKTCFRIFLFRRNLAILFWFEESRLSISINWSLRRGRKRPLINSLISF